MFENWREAAWWFVILVCSGVGSWWLTWQAVRLVLKIVN